MHLLAMDGYERALHSAGSYGRFQKRFSIIYNFIFIACNAIVYMNVVMVLTVPPHHCRLPQKPNDLTISNEHWKKLNLPIEEDSKGRGSYSSCHMYANSNSSEVTACTNGFEYDRTWYHSTIASDNDWVCDRELLVANAFAYSRIAEIIGGLTLGWLGDKFGRKISCVTTLLFMITGRTVTIFSSGSFVLFFGGVILAAVSSTGAGQSAMLISMETTSADKHANVVMIQNIGWATGIATLPLFYWWLKDWYPFLLITTLVIVPYLALSWHLIESPRWLWTIGRKKECLKLIRFIAKSNGNDLPAEVEKELLETSPKDITSNLGPLALLSSTTLALNTFLLFSMWFSSIFCYAILLFACGEDNTNDNPFVQLFWQGIAEIPGYVVGAWLSNRFGRRITSCSTFGVAALSQVIFLITLNSSSQIEWWWKIILIMITKSCITGAYYNSSLMAAEIYPTCLRQSGLSLGTLCAGSAFALTPYLTYIGRRFDAKMPFIILAIFSAIGGLSGSLLPETLNAALPETLEEARVFGGNRTKNYFKLPQRITETGQFKESAK